MTLKLATAEDYPHIIRMARAFHQASPYADLEFSEEKCEQMFRLYLTGDKRELIIILAVSESPSTSGSLAHSAFGMIVGFANSIPFSNEKIAAELAWWVDEERRGTKDSLLLFKAYEDWAVRIGAKVSQMAMLDDVTNLSKFYIKQGYAPAERSYVKRI